MYDTKNFISRRLPMTCSLLLLAGTTCLQAQSNPSLTTIYSFPGGSGGADSEAAPLASNNGILYGTTNAGGNNNLGIVYSLTPPASPGGEWTATELYKFNGKDGARPAGTLIFGPKGQLYGATGGKPAYHGDNDAVVFMLKPPAKSGGAWRNTVLYDFGEGLTSNVTAGSGGILYGSTAAEKSINEGTVFSLTPPAAGGSWTESTLYTFTEGPGGYNPQGQVVIGNDGLIYGAAGAGGAYNAGAVFALTPPAAAGDLWTESAIYSFTYGHNGSLDGNAPLNLVSSATGVLYGVTASGGANNYGTVFSLTPPAQLGGAWTEEVLHSFAYEDGTDPYTTANLLIDGDGNIYGTVPTGGTYGYGAVYSLTPPASAGGAWTYTILYAFTGGSDGGYSFAGLAFGPGGLIYGTTTGGGAFGNGTVFSLQP